MFFKTYIVAGPWTFKTDGVMQITSLTRYDEQFFDPLNPSFEKISAKTSGLSDR